MKKLLIGIIGICLVAGLAIAADPTLSGKTYTTTINDDLYFLEFVQGPFGPGENGYAILSFGTGYPLDGGYYNTMLTYAFENPICTISTESGDSITFILINRQLKQCVIPENPLTFDEVTE